MSIYFNLAVLLIVFGFSACYELKINYPGPRIFGGTPINHGEAPYQALVLYTKDHKTLEIICSGIIIDRNVVIAPAHRINVAHDVKNYYIYAGKIRIDENAAENFYRVEEIVIHPEFNATSYKNDIAKLKVNSEFIQGLNLKPALLTTRTVSTDELCSISSWGLSASNEIGLLKSEVKTIQRSKCIEDYSELKIDDPDKRVCAQSIDDSKICLIDAGAPLLCGNTVVGVGSVVYGCTSPSKTTSVYLEISQYMEWIEGKSSASYASNSLNCIFIMILTMTVLN